MEKTIEDILTVLEPNQAFHGADIQRLLKISKTEAYALVRAAVAAGLIERVGVKGRMAMYERRDSRFFGPPGSLEKVEKGGE